VLQAPTLNATWRASIERRNDAISGNPTHNPAHLINTGAELFVVFGSRLFELILMSGSARRWLHCLALGR
jgi:hypothetical protein